jgi:hypothetical protein
MWQAAWVQAVDQLGRHWPEPYRVVQNRGRGLLIQGTKEWRDYQVSAAITVHLARAAGIALRVQGLQRYYALLLFDDGTARLIKALDGDTVLAQTRFSWQLESTYELRLQAVGARLQAWIDGPLLFDLHDAGCPLSGGGVALVCEEGAISCEAVTVRPAE